MKRIQASDIVPAMHGPARLAMFLTPLLVFQGCSPWAEEAAAALLVALPAAYCLSLAVLALLAWLWRKQPEAAVEWRWLLGYAVVVTLIAVIAGAQSWPPLDTVLVGGMHEALFICACLCMLVRASMALGTKLILRIGAAVILAVFVIPAVLVFFVRSSSGEAIMLAIIDVLFSPARWLCSAMVLALLVEALVRGASDLD